MNTEKGFANLSDEELLQVSGGTYTGPCFTYTVKKNQCLADIANENHTTVTVLMEINNIGNPDLLYVGQTILIPS